MKHIEWVRMICELEVLFGSANWTGLANALHEWSETILAQHSPEIQQAYSGPEERIPLEGNPPFTAM